MYTTFFSVALFFGLAINAVFADFPVSTPDIFACNGSEVNLSWQPTAAPPYSVLLVSAEDPCGDPIMDLGDTQNSVMSMKTDKLKEGLKVQISVEDSNGDEGWSGDITVQKCVAASSVAASSVAASSGAAASSSGYAGPVAATTLIVTPTLDVTGSSSDAAPSGSVAPIGAANAADPFGNAASVPRHISVPAVALSVVAGVIALL